MSQKRYIRRALRKPRNMKMREWLARVNEMNNHSPRFPRSGPQQVDPTKLDDDEIKEIAECGIPHNWQQQMRLQNFDVTEKTVPEFIDFCERFEQLETSEGGTDNPRKTNDEKTPKKGNERGRQTDRRNNNSDSSGKVEHHCTLHGSDDGHKTVQTAHDSTDREKGSATP